MKAETASIAASETLKSLFILEFCLDRKGYTEDAKEMLGEIKKELEALHKSANTELGID